MHPVYLTFVSLNKSLKCISFGREIVTYFVSVNIAVQLTSCCAGLDLSKQVNVIMQAKLLDPIFKQVKPGGQP